MTARRKTLCRTFEAGESAFGNDLTAGGYLAAVFRDVLPRAASSEDRIVRHGYGVGFGPNGHWYFFHDIAPALAFGRAARMSLECSGYGVFQAAHELLFCPTHNADERVLHLTGDNVDRNDDELEHLKRFVQGVKEHPWSSNWHLTDRVHHGLHHRPTDQDQAALPAAVTSGRSASYRRRFQRRRPAKVTGHQRPSALAVAALARLYRPGPCPARHGGPPRRGLTADGSGSARTRPAALPGRDQRAGPRCGSAQAGRSKE